MSAHPLFNSFLFDELGTILNIDYETAIKADKYYRSLDSLTFCQNRPLTR